jgi:hypothetical protein
MKGMHGIVYQEWVCRWHCFVQANISCWLRKNNGVANTKLKLDELQSIEKKCIPYKKGQFKTTLSYTKFLRYANDSREWYNYIALKEHAAKENSNMSIWVEP